MKDVKRYFNSDNCISLVRKWYDYESRYSYISQQGIDFKNKDILSLGSGEGYFEELLLKKCRVRSITLVDFSEACVQKLRKKFTSQEIYNSDFNNIDNVIPHSRKFDVIYSIDVMQYLSGKAIRSLNKVLLEYLKKDGIIYHFGIPDERRKWLYRINNYMIMHNFNCLLGKFDFVDQYSQWHKRSSFSNRDILTTFITPSLSWERFDVKMCRGNLDER